MPVSNTGCVVLPAMVVLVLVVAAACLTSLGVSLYSTDKAVARVRVHGSSSDGSGVSNNNNNNTVMSTVITTTTTTQSTPTPPTLYPPTEKQAQRPIDVKGYDDYWLVVSPQRQVAITIIPKVMCSSVRAAMNDIECSKLKSSSSNYNPRCAEARMAPVLHKLLPTFSNYTRVVFYRDPIERALSTYHNSETNKYIKVEGCETWKNCTFEYWVDQLADYQFATSRRNSKTPAKRNEHFLKQTVISQRTKMHYHYRLRMTNKEHVTFFFEQLLKTKPRSANQSSNSKAKSKQSSSNVNNATSSTATTTTSLQDDTKAYVAKKFDPISTQALIKLLTIYEDDFRLWETMVASSPKGPNEYTMWDYYKEHLEEELRPQVEQYKKEQQKKNEGGG